MRRAFILCGVLCGGLITAMPAAAQFGGGGFGPQAPPKPPEDPRPIQLTIAILDVTAAEKAAKLLSEEEQIARLERLEAEGKLTGVQRYKLNLVSNQNGEFQHGETVQMTVGRNVRPGGDPGSRGGFNPVNMGDVTRSQQVGTLIRAIAKPVTGGAVTELVVERSGAVNPRPPVAEGGAAQEYPKVSQLNVKTTLVLKEGQTTVIASGIVTNADRPNDETWVLARVTVAPLDAAKVTIFNLKNIAADDTVNMISSLFNRGDVRAIADVRTNTIIVVTAPADILQQIEAILQRLDESPAAAAATPQVRKIVPIPDNSAPLFNPAPARKLPAGRAPLDDLNNTNPGQ